MSVAIAARKTSAGTPPWRPALEPTRFMGRLTLPAIAISHGMRQDDSHHPQTVRAIFGDFVLDTGRRELSRGLVPVHVSGKALQLLELILRAAPEAVSKEQVYRHLWGNVVVEETNIANLISDLRRALSDHRGASRLIRTIYRFGYRFDGEVEWRSQDRTAAPSVASRSWIVWAGREYPLSPGENVIGRDPHAKVSINSAAISRRHALLNFGVRATIEDLGSKNGTFVADQRITAPTEIHDGDTLGFGSVRVLFRLLGDVGTTVTELGSLKSLARRN